MESSGAASFSSPSSACRTSSRRDCVGYSTATVSAPSRESSQGWASSPSPSWRGATPCGPFPDRSSSRSGRQYSARSSSSTSRSGSIGSARGGPRSQAPEHRPRDREIAEGEHYVPGRQAPQGRTYCDSSTPPGGMYRLPHSQDQIAASFPPANSILVTV